jgi:hypothetical protein
MEFAAMSRFWRGYRRTSAAAVLVASTVAGVGAASAGQ